MAQITVSADAKATMKANLELELKARREKLLAMCEAQVASLRSRLERRVNRVPLKQRKLTMGKLIASTNFVPAPAPTIPATRPAHAIAAQEVAPQPATKTTRQKPLFKTLPGKIAFKKMPIPAPEPASKAIMIDAARAKPTRAGTKRTSNEISAEDKENTGELHVPKKRAKAAPTAPAPPVARATRTTRAASKKVAPSAQILSPKTNNAHPAPQTRTRRQR